MLRCYIYFLFGFIYMNSPYLCVCGDDHVTCYMGVDVDAGEQANA